MESSDANPDQSGIETDRGRHPKKGEITDLWLRGQIDDETEGDVEDKEEREARNLLVGEILERTPELALVKMIAAHCDMDASNPGFVVLGARIGGMMKFLGGLPLEELEEYREKALGGFN